MKITRTPDKKVILDGSGEFVLTHLPYQFHFDGVMYENAEPRLTLMNFRHYRVCPKHLTCKFKATWAAIKFIWLGK